MSEVKACVFRGTFYLVSLQHAKQLVYDLFRERFEIKWFHAQVERDYRDNLILRAVWGYHRLKTPSYVNLKMGTACHIVINTAETIKRCTDASRRVTNLYWEGGTSIHKIMETPVGMFFRGEYSGSFQPNPVSNIIFNRAPLSRELLNEQTIVLCGDFKYGLKQYAVSHFKNPVVISKNLDFHYVNIFTDGLVVDVEDINKWTFAKLKSFVQRDTTSNQEGEYGSVIISRDLPRIICVPTEGHFWPLEVYDIFLSIHPRFVDDVKNISNRLCFIKIQESLF